MQDAASAALGDISVYSGFIFTKKASILNY
jgi:hypothetical protein